MSTPVSVELSSFSCIVRTDYNVANLTSSYQPLNVGGFSDDIKILKIDNTGSTAGIDISYDGVTPMDYYSAGCTLIVDLQTNHACNSSYASGTKNGRKGQVIYGLAGTAGTGTIRIIGYR